jgi:hypothetical protein
MATMNVSLTQELIQVIKRKVSSGMYNNSRVKPKVSPKIRDGFGQQRPCGVTHVFCALAPSLHQKSGWI